MAKTKSHTFWIAVILSVVALFLSPKSSLLAANELNAGPVSDSILQQQRDSMLFKLNLQYLNGVNDSETPFELISIIEEILELDPTLHNHWFNLGLENIKIKEYDRALEALTAGLELYLNTDYLVAENYFRVAYQYDPDNIEKLGALAWVLIQNALKIDEGMILIDQAIEADPTNAIFLHQQGYGYYMKGNYEDALFNLYNARDLYRQYSFELNSHIEMVEQAIARTE